MYYEPNFQSLVTKEELKDELNKGSMTYEYGMPKHYTKPELYRFENKLDEEKRLNLETLLLPASSSRRIDNETKLHGINEFLQLVQERELKRK
ncbi:9127_t:CDS:2, partial [Gigaspora rosea]